MAACIRHPGRRRGVTLLESLLACVLLAAAIGSIIWPFVSAGQAQAHAIRQSQAAALAEEMLEEILACPFDDPDGPSDPGPEPGEDARSRFDNADDYDGYTEPAGSVRSADGEIFDDPRAGALSRTVHAEYVYVDGQDTRQDPTFLRVTVRVEYLGRDLAELTRLIYRLP